MCTRLLTTTFFTLFLISCSLIQPADWKEFSHMRGNYKVDFRGEPIIENVKDTVEGEVIEWVQVYTNVPDKNNYVYAVYYADLPEEVTSDSLDYLHGLFKYNLKNIREEMGRESLVSFEQTEIQKYPGRESLWINKQKNLGLIKRTYLVKNRLYSLEVSFPAGKKGNEDIRHFFDSFGLISAKDNDKTESKIEKTDKNFKIRFPGSTIVQNHTFYLPEFGNLHEVLQFYQVPDDEFYLVKTTNFRYAISYIKIPEERLGEKNKEKLKQLIKDVFKLTIENNYQGRILHFREIDYKGKYWGIEGQGLIYNENAILHIRTYLIDNYCYQLSVGSHRGTQNNAESINFFESFELLH